MIKDNETTSLFWPSNVYKLMANKGDKQLSAIQLFDQLQIEYIVCNLRAHIYPRDEHKIYWRAKAVEKRDRIKDIASKNSLMSIFDHQKIKESIENKIFNMTGLPNFCYASEEVKQKQFYWDVYNFFSRGGEVEFFDEEKSSIAIGVIKYTDVKAEKVTVVFKGKELILNFDNVKRVNIIGYEYTRLV